MAAAFKLRGQKGVQDFSGLRGGSVARAQAEDIGVVMLAGKRGHVLVEDQRGAHAADLVGGHAHADARRANQKAEFAPLGRDQLSHRPGVIGVIANFGRIGPDIGQGNALLLQVVLDRLLQAETGVVATNGAAGFGGGKRGHQRLGGLLDEI